MLIFILRLYSRSVLGIKAYVPDATAPSAADRAARYADTLRRVVPMGNNFPRFDLVVLGMGKDGHIGSLYPGRNEVNEQTAFVLPVDKVSHQCLRAHQPPNPK